MKKFFTTQYSISKKLMCWLLIISDYLIITLHFENMLLNTIKSTQMLLNNLEKINLALTSF